nr:ribonuclease H-like domain-containing protein [Tanacetum cinerariifolium]
MVVEDTPPPLPPPPPPPTPTDKSIPFSIPNKVPIKLDLEKHNYNPWSSFSLIHLAVLGLNPMWKLTPPPPIPNGVNLMISSRCGSSDPYDVRAINLDNELCSIKIGKMTVNKYCTKIQAMANRLKNLDCEVSVKNMVIFAVNGLDSRFATLAEIIRHRKPFLTFETVHNIILLKESSFNNDSTSTTFESSLSYPTILMAISASDNKHKTPNLPQLCNHFRDVNQQSPHSYGLVQQQAQQILYVAYQPHGYGTAQQQPAYQRHSFHGQPSNCQSILGAAPALHPSQATSLPSAFSTMSLQDPTWNMDTAPPLGNLGDEVLCSLTSRRFISCNKKSSHICHACQLGKHVKLPFHSSDSIVRIVKPIERLSFHTSSLSPIPKSLFIALKDPNWCNAMYDEYNALVKNGTWILIPKPSDVNLARLVANGSNQHHSVDFDETFSPVVKPATIRIVLRLVVSRQWPIHQLDVKNVFLHDDLSKTLYMRQPLSFVDSLYPNHIVGSLHKEFDMIDLGELNYFLGISVVRNPTSLHRLQFGSGQHSCLGSYFIPQSCKGLGYLTFTRPDLSYAFQQICLYMHDPNEPHLAALKRILRFVQGTLEFGLHLYASATTYLVGYTDVDWAGCPSTRRSTSGYCVFLGDNLLSWSSKRQHTISHSSAEAEYRGVANVVVETAWIRNLLRKLHSPFLTATLVYCDKVSAVYMSANSVQHQRTKHIEIDIHFVRDMVKACHVRVLHVPSRFQYADVFTKGLPLALFEDFRSSLRARPPPTQTARAY